MAKNVGLTVSGKINGAVNGKVIGRLRLVSQGLLGPGFSSVPDAVRSMTAMQAQDLPAAMWAVGCRVPGAGLSDVRAALDAGTVVRSWPMRGTLHLVAPEDLRWMLDLTAERLLRSVAPRHRELGIAWADIEKCRDIALELISADGPASRAGLFAAFEAAGQPTTGQRGIHILGTLCRHAWLVLGPMAGNQQQFAAFDQWIPVSRKPEGTDALAEWMLRYFTSHGPATIRDFAWWTQLPLTQVRAAFESVRDQLVCLEFAGTEYWLSPTVAALLEEGVPGSRSVLLLPGYDEFLLGYMDRSLVLDTAHSGKIVPGGNGVFKKTLVAGGEVIGTWALQGTGSSAAVVPELFEERKPPVYTKAARRYLDFLAG
ncbi:winged helix DNA-binding domain-containing protein [Pseudarthrobacter sp. J64]|uniref:winged helix DNA-binding domain-containing protein n=1 Tax=Pseudarthrobacter sp. J64 TaxID=3116485 RepID=UPI002E8107EB|nr:winged helix DNA-binding domain-containing protein [Pseudarthrobacter sp. J64]MEE2568030.1 winged helix DNA-binding domain-containing protein [Pseudarthrobacter sp. J64]